MLALAEDSKAEIVSFAGNLRTDARLEIQRRDLAAVSASLHMHF
jgi:hypothetical protein